MTRAVPILDSKFTLNNGWNFTVTKILGVIPMGNQILQVADKKGNQFLLKYYIRLSPYNDIPLLLSRGELLAYKSYPNAYFESNNETWYDGEEILMPFYTGVILREFLYQSRRKTFGTENPAPNLETLRLAEQLTRDFTELHFAGVVHGDCHDTQFIVDQAPHQYSPHKLIWLDWGHSRQLRTEPEAPHGHAPQTGGFIAPEVALLCIDDGGKLVDPNSVKRFFPYLRPKEDPVYEKIMLEQREKWQRDEFTLKPELTAASDRYSLGKLLLDSFDIQLADVKKLLSFNPAERPDLNSVRAALAREIQSVAEKQNQRGFAAFYHILAESLLDYTEDGVIALSIVAQYQSQAEVMQEALRYAAFHHETSVAKLLLNSGVRLEEESDRQAYYELMLAAAKSNDVEFIDTLRLIAPLNFLYRGQDGLTALHHACQHGHVRMAEKLLGLQPNLLEQQNNAQETPLFFAVRHQKPAVANYLIEKHGAKTDLHNRYGLSVVKYAAHSANNNLLMNLLQGSQYVEGTNLEEQRLLDAVFATGNTKQFDNLMRFVINANYTHLLVMLDGFMSDTPSAELRLHVFTHFSGEVNQ